MITLYRGMTWRQWCALNYGMSFYQPEYLPGHWTLVPLPCHDTQISWREYRSAVLPPSKRYHNGMFPGEENER
jgi:hypothetical protein